MNDPIKIIFKFKNNNRRMQHHIYIYVGQVTTNIATILNKIKKLSLYDTIISLSKSEHSKMEKNYGIKWFNFFFNIYHINHTIDIILNNKQKQREIIKSLGQEWYNNNIDQTINQKKIYYSFESLIKQEKIRQEKKKKSNKKDVDDENIDYRTNKKLSLNEFKIKNKQSNNDVNNSVVDKNELKNNENDYDMEDYIYKIHKYMHKKNDKKNDYNNEIIMDNKSFDEKLNSRINNQYYESLINKSLENRGLNDILMNGGGDEQSQIIPLDDIENNNVDIDGEDDEIKKMELEEEVDMEEDMDIEDIEKIYQNMDTNIDKNVYKTSELIKKALQDENIMKKTKVKLVDFDRSKDNNIYDENLKDVYDKNYVTTQYIFKDDTIKMLKNKICCSILNNSKFEKDSYIIPSRQYLWSEYYFNEKINKIMIGQKWIKRSELLHIDVEPNNNIKYYEESRGNLKLLRDNIKRYGSKIKREDDDFNILYDYDGYYLNNEIYMIDIYNELGTGYKPDQEDLKNIADIYFRIYFPRISQDDINNILDYLNKRSKVEHNKISTIYETLNNDLIITNQIMYDVENIKKTSGYKKIFKENYITQSVIHVNLRLKKDHKIDLHRIFNEFAATDKYPFIQYQTLDGQIIFKYNEKHINEYSNEKENMEVLTKWFENSPYGISFKVKIMERNTEKFMAINLNENGRIEYKTQWKEDDMATVLDIKNTYGYVKDLIKKLNGEKNKLELEIPHDNEFKYAFINTIQKFELPEKFIINHNDLSEFSRYFYPYVALVIEPRKRQSRVRKIDNKSKFGTYLRYKRVSKYDNQSRIEHRILYFTRNYDYNDKSLSNEISKQFNITLERAMEEIDRVKKKYPNIKRSRKILKKLENIPKYKPPGIGIDIQGKQRDKYKIRISGARNKDQLDRIIDFMNILIHLYTETYLYKRPEKQFLKEKLKNLTNIAHRRNKVDEIVTHEQDEKSVKKMAMLDKKRIGFKPEKGQNQWTRSCQNSGNDKKRRPQQYTSSFDLLKQGFKLDKKNNIYEKQTTIKTKKGKKKEITIRAVGLGGAEGAADDTIFYSCNPQDNGKHMYIGFLSRSSNPYGQCMPCCFKKDPMLSKNKEKRNFFMSCIGQKKEIEKTTPKILGDKLYILQDTNKIQDGRFGFLPKHLDFFFNSSIGNKRKIKHHYLINTDPGYFFKYGSKQDEYPFLNAVSSLINLNISQIKEKIIETLNKDKNDMIFTALNNGDTKTIFKTRDNFIEFIKTSNYITFETINHFLSIPGIIEKNGLNIIVFNKVSYIVRKKLEKEQTIDDFIITCQNYEEVDNIKDQKRKTLFIVKENNNYYPIVYVIKENDEKQIEIIKTYNYGKNKMIDHVLKFYEINCKSNILNDIQKNANTLTAKSLYNILLELGDNNYLPKYQIIDTRNKCKYIICNNLTIIPVKPSGSIFNLTIIKNFDNKLLSVKNTLSNLNKLFSLSNKSLPVKPIGLYYDKKTDKNVNIIGIVTNYYDVVPVKEEIIDLKWIFSQGLIIENKQLYDKIDAEIKKGQDNIINDQRITQVNTDKYIDESYELFRLELSEFLDQESNDFIKKKIIDLISSPAKNMNKIIIRKILYKLIDKKLFDLYVSTLNSDHQNGGVKDIISKIPSKKFINIISKLPNVQNYKINNNRDVCSIYDDKNKCNNNPHCSWSNNKCNFVLTDEMVIKFVNKISEELINNQLKASEILKREGYFVSDIVDYNNFTTIPGQKIIKSTNFSIDKLLGELFGKDNIPIIGKRRNFKGLDLDYQQMNIENPLQDMGEYYIQKIINNNLSIFRTFTNGYYWIKQSYYDLDNRNMGYYSNLQTSIANFFRSVIIDWIYNDKNIDIINYELKKYINFRSSKNFNFIQDFINRLNKDISTNTNCIVELFILNKIYNIPIIVYNDMSEVIYVFDDGIKYNFYDDDKTKFNNKKFDKYRKREVILKSISIKLHLTNSDIPDQFFILYHK